MVRINLVEYKSLSAWHTLIGLHVLGYLQDRSRVCALVRVLFCLSWRLCMRSPAPSGPRSHWLHVSFAFMFTLALIHLLGAAPTPVMVHFLSEDTLPVGRLVQLLCDASIVLFLVLFMVPAAQRAAPLPVAV